MFCVKVLAVTRGQVSLLMVHQSKSASRPPRKPQSMQSTQGMLGFALAGRRAIKTCIEC